ncbi:MAG: hypothetical protein RLZZ135_1014 [Cyanobacteriota bacterium]
MLKSLEYKLYISFYTYLFQFECILSSNPLDRSSDAANLNLATLRHCNCS